MEEDFDLHTDYPLLYAFKGQVTVFVIGNNESLSYRNLKVVCPLGGEFDFSVPRDLNSKQFNYRTSKILLC